MFDNLRTSLRTALKKVVGASDINEELIDSLCKDVQRALLQSDVNVQASYFNYKEFERSRLK